MKYLPVISLMICLQYACLHKNEDIFREGKWECLGEFFQGGNDRYNPVCYAIPDTLFYGLGEPPVSLDFFWNSDIALYTKDGWKKLTEFPGNRRVIPLLVASSHKVYVGLGEVTWGSPAPEYLKDVWEYDIARQRWDSLPYKFPGTNTRGTVRFSLDGNIYWGMGMNGNEYVPGMYILYPEHGWQLLSYGQRRAYSTVFELEGEVYCCFGKNGEGYIRTVCKFNPETAQWEFIHLFDEVEYPFIARTDAMAFVIKENGKDFVYFIGGKAEKESADFWDACRYDPRTQKLEKISLPFPRSEVRAAFTIQNNGYIFDGEFVWKYIPDVP